MWFNQPADLRITCWRDWRNSLENKNKEEILREVAATWAKVPSVMHFLTPDDVHNWPNAWRLIYDNYYCELGICLGMYYTLTLLETTKFNDIKIEIHKTPDGWINLSSIDQGKYVLNYSHGCVVNSQQVLKRDLNLMYEYSNIDLSNKIS